MEAATLLITSGASVDLVDSDSKYELIEYLLKSGADVNSKIRDHNTTALHQAILCGLRELILTRRVDKNFKSPKLEGG